MIVFSLAVIGFYAWYANYIPQIESHPPKKISLDAGLTEDEQIEAGERVFNAKGTCNICHAIGRPGNRGPDLANVFAAAGTRKPGLSANEYLLESLLAPAAFLVKGYGALMPQMGNILTGGEIMVTVAYLQSLTGKVTIRPEQVRAALAKYGGAPATSAASRPAARQSAASRGTEATGQGNAAKGKEIYLANCVACHGPDPSVDGPVGPSIRGSSHELIEARVIRAAYPPGYAPKRPTRLMPPMPQLQGQLGHLAAFLGGKE